MRPIRRYPIINTVTHDSDGWHDTSQLTTHLAPTLALLRAVASESHLTRAAQRLGMPQPTVSRALARLSRELGAPVVAREGRGVHLTRVGNLLADAASEALRSLEAGCRSVVEELDPERGQVVLGFQHTMGSTLIPALLSGFRADHPHVRFGLVQGARADMLRRMLDGEIDLCLTSPLPSADDAVAAVALRDEPLRAVLFANHRLARRKKIGLAELADDDFIATRPGYGLRQIFTELAHESGFRPRLAFECEEVDTVRGLVAAGLGVALLPPADTGTADGTVELPLDPPSHRTIGLAWPAQRTVPPAVRSFRDFALANATR